MAARMPPSLQGHRFAMHSTSGLLPAPPQPASKRTPYDAIHRNPAKLRTNILQIYGQVYAQESIASTAETAVRAYLDCRLGSNEGHAAIQDVRRSSSLSRQATVIGFKLSVRSPLRLCRQDH